MVVFASFSSLIFPTASARAAAPTDTLTETAITSDYRQTQIEDLKTFQPKPPEEEKRFLYGIWSATSYRLYGEQDHDPAVKEFVRALFSQDFRVWGDYTIRPNLSVYAMGRMTYKFPDTGPDYTGSGEDLEGPLLENLYLNYRHEVDQDLDFTAKVGRQFLYAGRGIAIADLYDAARLDFHWKKLYGFAFGAHTLAHADNIDYSAPNYRKDGERLFGGFEIGYAVSNPLYFYGFIVTQDDRSESDTSDPRQNHHYDSTYYGTGLTYQPTSQWQSWLEGIYEDGATHPDARFAPRSAESDIEAWAYTLGTQYRFETTFHPTLELEHAFGSGDEDRTNVTNADGGDRDGEDTNFLYFGSYQGGYSLSPALSNIFINKISLYLKPLEAFEPTKDLAIGAKLYFYFKDEPAGGISDTAATADSSDIGNEWDFFLHWKINANVKFSTRFGIFTPGDAFPAAQNTPSTFLFARLIITY